MELLIVGAGGVGGCLAAHLAASGEKVTLIARGEHLRAIRERGLTLRRTHAEDLPPVKVAACTAEEYAGTPDAALLCVKEYALEGVLPLLARFAGTGTLVVPLLNGVGVGDRLAARLPGVHLLDGCFYGSAFVSAPGEITQSGPLLRVVCGEREPEGLGPRLEELRETLEAAGARVVLSPDIRRDTFRKFMLISPMAATGAYFDAPVGAAQRPGPERETFCRLVEELAGIGAALGYDLPADMVEDGLKRLDAMGPEVTASLQKDLAKGGASELDGQLFEPVRLARRLGVPAPCYEKIAARFGFAE